MSKFIPFHQFIYNDFVFIKNHINKLIPSGKDLTFFNEVEFEKTNENVLKAAFLITEQGVPEFVSNLHLELYPNSLNHLIFINSLTTIDFIFHGMGYDKNEFNKWRLLLNIFLLSNWFSPNIGTHILINSPLCLHPLRVLKIKSFESEFYSGIFDSIINDYFKQEKLTIDNAVLLIKKIQLFGITNEILLSLDPYPYFYFSHVFDIIQKYTPLRTKEAHKLLGTLLTLYFPAECIRAALKT